MILYLYGMFIISSSSAFHSLQYARSVASSQWMLHILWYSAPHPISSVHFFPECRMSYSSCLCLLHPPVTFVLFYLSFSNLCFRRHFICKMWPIELAFLFFILNRIFLSLTVCNASSFLTHIWSNWSSPFFCSTIFHNFPGISDLKCPHFSTTQCYAPHVALLVYSLILPICS